MALKKMVNGELVEMTAAEEAAITAEWAANAAKISPDILDARLTADSVLAVLVETAAQVTGKTVDQMKAIIRSRM